MDVKVRSMARAVQSVLHQHIHDRRVADELGHGIADFIAANWETIMQDFGDDTSDEIDIAERVARIVIEKLTRPDHAQAA
jgi:hypothetical protein